MDGLGFRGMASLSVAGSLWVLYDFMNAGSCPRLNFALRAKTRHAFRRFNKIVQCPQTAGLDDRLTPRKDLAYFVFSGVVKKIFKLPVASERGSFSRL